MRGVRIPGPGKLGSHAPSFSSAGASLRRTPRSQLRFDRMCSSAPLRTPRQASLASASGAVFYSNIYTHLHTHMFPGFSRTFFCARRSYRSSCRLAESKLIARVAFEPPVPGVAPFLFDFDRLRRLFSSIFIIFDFCWMGAGCEASAGEDTRILRCVRLHRWLRSWLLFRALFRETFSFAIVAISLVRIALYDLLVYSFIALR